MAVHVFYCNVESLRSEKLFDHYLSRMSLERQERIAHLRHEEDRVRSLGAGLMLHCALNAMQVPFSQRAVRRLKDGKPILTDTCLQFSLSHSGSVAMCAISQTAVGADVQALRAPNQTLPARVCSVEEQHWLVSQPDLAAAFSSLWARKESLLKAIGKTISEDLRRLSCLDGENPDWQFSEKILFALPACVCCPEGEQVLWHEIDPTCDEIQISFDSSSQF